MLKNEGLSSVTSCQKGSLQCECEGFLDSMPNVFNVNLEKFKIKYRPDYGNQKTSNCPSPPPPPPTKKKKNYFQYLSPSLHNLRSLYKRRSSDSSFILKLSFPVNVINLTNHKPPDNTYLCDRKKYIKHSKQCFTKQSEVCLKYVPVA